MPFQALIRAVDSALPLADAFRLAWGGPDWLVLQGQVHRRALKPGEVLIEHRRIEPVMYLIESGTFQVYLPMQSTARKPVAILRSGAVVGEPAMFADNPRMAQVDAMTAAVVWAMPRSGLEAIAKQHPVLGMQWYQACGAVMAARMLANVERGMPAA